MINNFYTIFLQKFCKNAVKWTGLLIYLFSATPLYFVFVIAALVALFYDTKANYLVFFCYCFLTFLLVGSFLLLLALNIKSSFAFLEELVGSSFIEKYFPPSFYGIRGLKPFLLFTITLCSLWIIDYMSLNWSSSMEEKTIDQMEKQKDEFFANHDPLPAVRLSKVAIYKLDHLHEIRGFFTGLVNHPTVTYYIEFFRIKR